jgi:hypothetical protein
MLLSIGLLLASQILIPALFLIWLWKGKQSSKLNWLSNLLVVTLWSSYIFLVGWWNWFSYYLRFVLVILLILAAFKSYTQARFLPAYPRKSFRTYFSLGVSSLAIIGFAWLNILAIQGYFFSDDPVHLAFPLRNGTYYVGHGGNSPTINYHNISRAQKYALDIVKLNYLGTRANGIYPTNLTKYMIFEDTLYSPCDGTIEIAQDGLPDLTPPEMDQENLAGNHILMQCEAVDVLMAHLLNGSVSVQEGESVQTGQAIAKIGNSGNTSEPHLHIHARKAGTATSILDGEGVPMLFNDRFLVRNSLVH